MRTPLLLFALLGPLPTSAFYPTKFRANLSMTPGISHEQMTEEVLTSVAASFFPSVAESLNGALRAPLSQGMLEARTAIVRSNVWVDWGYHDPYWHFGGDSDIESMDALESARAAVVRYMFEGDVGVARTNLGQALHLLQDFYAYRNPAEEGGDFEKLWRRDLLSQSAMGRDDSLSHGHTGGSPYGMLHGKSRDRAHQPAMKDSHLQKQGAEDAHRKGMAGYSLDPSDPDIHLQAVKLAKDASETFINYLAEYLTDRQLQHLFGLSLDSAILVEPTVFASPDWEDAKAKIGTIFGTTSEPEADVNRGVKYTTISLLSESPMAVYEDWYSLDATNASQSLDMLRDTVAGYVVGCRGINLEAVLGALQQFKTGGELIFVVGQNFLQDSEVEHQIVDFIANNPVAVSILQLDAGCPREDELTLSQSVADLSGGKYITALDTRETLALPRDGALEAQAGLSVILLTSDSDGTPPQNGIRFPVDGSMDRLLITVDWAAPAESPMKVLFSDPEDKTFEPVSRKADGEIQRAIWKVDSPVPGEWAFNFGGAPIPSYNLTIKGRSSIQLVHASIVESTGITGHEGYFEILNVLPAETEVGVVGEIYGLAPADNSSVEWLVVDADNGDEMKIPMTAGLDPAERPGYADKNTFFGSTMLSESNFYLVVRGVDAQGYKFQRSVPSRMSATYDSDHTYEIGDVDSVVDFPDDDSEDAESESESEESQVIIVARQIVTGTGAATGTPVTLPGATPFSPTGPAFPNATAFPGTGATTLGGNATAPPLPTGATSILPGTASFNTSVPSVTIPIPGATNVTSPSGATETAGATLQPPVSVPTGPSLPGSTETLTTVATILSPPNTGGSNATSGVPLTSSLGGNATATAQAGPVEATATVSVSVPVTVTAQCHEPAPPGETIASQDAISQPAPSSSSRQGCKACEAQSPEGPAAPPKETFTEAQHPVPYSQPEQPQDTVVIAPTVAVESTVETTSTLKPTSVIPAKTPACAPEGYGPGTPAEAPNPHGSPAEAPKPHRSPAASLPSTSSVIVYGGAFTASANGTLTRQGHAGHTTSSPGAEETSGADETAGETASGEGIKGVRAGVVAVVVVATGGMVFLIL